MNTRRILPLLAALVLASAGCGDDPATVPTASALPPATPTGSIGSGAIEVDLGTGSALVWGSGEYGVILVHGAIYDAASWAEQAETFAAEGFAVIAVENTSTDDIRAAIDYLRRTFGTTHVALVGASAGTGPVLTAASEREPTTEPIIDLVVILAGSGDVENLNVPSVLFISAEGDGGSASAAERMMEATTGSSEDLLLVPGSAHAQAIFNEPEGEQVLTAIVERLRARQSAIATEP